MVERSKVALNNLPGQDNTCFAQVSFQFGLTWTDTQSTEKKNI